MRILLAAPILLLLVLFALSNQQTVRLGIWPTDFAVDAPLSLTVLVAMAAAFVLGAAARRRARRAEYQARLLEAQVQQLQARLKTPPAAAPFVPASRAASLQISA
jgi:uncharacterized integral membrane protein